MAAKLRFNPRLTSAARRTRRMARALPRTQSFNPRLTSAARRTRPVQMDRRIRSVSIRASLQQRGERIRRG